MAPDGQRVVHLRPASARRHVRLGRECAHQRQRESAYRSLGRLGGSPRHDSFADHHYCCHVYPWKWWRCLGKPISSSLPDGRLHFADHANFVRGCLSGSLEFVGVTLDQRIFFHQPRSFGHSARNCGLVHFHPYGVGALQARSVLRIHPHDFWHIFVKLALN